MWELEDDYTDFNNVEDDFNELEELTPNDGLVLQIFNRSGEIDDVIIGYEQIKTYILNFRK